MFSSAIIALFIASAAIAAPTPSIPSEVDSRNLVQRACSNPNLFQNPGFNSTGPAAWSLINESGTGKVTGTYQKTYFPVSWPTYGGPSAYALTFQIPATKSKTVDLQQSIPATNSKSDYDMSFNMYLYGTTSASCVAAFHSGAQDLGGSISMLPRVKSTLPNDNFSVVPRTVGGNNYDGINPSNGAIFTCTAGSTDATVTIYIDNAQLNVAC